MTYNDTNYLATILFILTLCFMKSIPVWAYDVTWNFDNPNPDIYSSIGDVEWSHNMSLPKKLSFSLQDIPGDRGSSYGVSAFDANGDSFLDIYVANLSGQNKLWINNGNGTFTNHDISGDIGESYGTATADIDGDGDIDIYTLNQVQNKLWMNDGTGSFTANDIQGDTGGSTDAVFFDADHDGNLDIYTTNFDTYGGPVQNKLWINGGTGSFTASHIPGDTSSSVSVTVADIDQDGDYDLYVATFGQNNLWINDGSNNGGDSFSLDAIPTDSGISYGVTSFDADGDGDIDLYTSNYATENNLWMNDGSNNGGLSFTAKDIMGDTRNAIESTVHDIDQDGDIDIYVAHFTGQNHLLINDGKGNFTMSNIQGDEGASYKAVIFDVNNDGLQDIYVGNIGQNSLWINQGFSYPDTSPYVELKKPLAITGSINYFKETLGQENQGSISYQLSTDNGETWYYYNESAWTQTLATDGSETSSIDELNTHIHELKDDDKQFLWRAYLNSDGNQPVVLKELYVNYDQLPNESNSSALRYICQDTEAFNYLDSDFGRHHDRICKYDATSIDSEFIQTLSRENLFGGDQCPFNLIITENIKNGDRNGQYSSYNQGTVTQVNLLQQHMNRLLLDEYGTQASGPVDGIFGPLTHKGVERLQNRLNQRLPGMKALAVDGIVGPFTKTAINQSCTEDMAIE